MTHQRSSDGYIGVGKQAAKGTAVAPDLFTRASGADGWDFAQDVVEIKSLNANQEVDDILKTGHNIDGVIPFYVRPDFGAAMAAFALGADTVTTGTVHTHTITRADTLPWITCERDLISAERAEDCKINQLVIAGEAGLPLTMEASFFGIDATIETATATSYETDVPFKFFEGTYTIDGSGATTITAFTITINRNLEKVKTTSYKYDDVVETSFTIDINMTLKLEAADTQYLAALYGGSTALTTALDGGSLVVNCSRGSGASERQFKVTVPNLYWTGATKHLDPNTAPVYVDVVGKSFWKTATEPITVVAKNTTSTQYLA
ncbi:hypothetical protein CMI37_06990 [Candidatus Pacearchaeota archaeon]|nr:hypothetical protein [Candidatus Pacearchaeota archaeon]